MDRRSLGPLVFVGFGLLFGGFGAAFIISMNSFVKKAVKVEGTVVDLRPGSGRGRTYRAVVKFKAFTGAEIEFVDGVGSSPPAHDIGDTVEVLYDPDNPRDAMINSFIGRWLFGGVFGFFGILFTVLGAVFFFKR